MKQYMYDHATELLTDACSDSKAKHIRTFIDDGIEAKADLHDIFKNCADYNGNMQIVKEIVFPRNVEKNSVSQCVHKFYRDLNNLFNTMVDDNGKSIYNIQEDTYSQLGLSTSPDALVDVNYDKLNEFDFRTTINNKRCDENSTLSSFIGNLGGRYCVEKIDANMAEEINLLFPFVRAQSGMKITRVAGKIFRHYGFENKVYESSTGCVYFNKEDLVKRRGDIYKDMTDEEIEGEGIHYGVSHQFMSHYAEYTDMVSGNGIRRKFVMSINPYDMLTCSNGRSWESCHNPHGIYRSGALSYALDDCTIMTYVIDKDDPTDHPESVSKIYRNMFHYKDGNLIQSRVYPQGNTGNLNLYKLFRSIVQETLCEGLGITYINEGGSNDTWKKHGKTPHNNGSYSNGRYHISWSSDGNQYRDYDYDYSDAAAISSIKNFSAEIPEDTVMHIGKMPKCLHCGKLLDADGNNVASRRHVHSVWNCTE